jgi:hypothetical protein
MSETDRAIRNIASRDAKGVLTQASAATFAGRSTFSQYNNKCQPNEQVDKQTGRYEGPV